MSILLACVLGSPHSPSSLPEGAKQGASKSTLNGASGDQKRRTDLKEEDPKKKEHIKLKMKNGPGEGERRDGERSWNEVTE